MRGYAAILLAVLGTSCGGGSSEPGASSPLTPTAAAAQTWTLSGVVTDSITGQAVGGATVTIDGRSFTTGAQGGWQIDGTGNMPPRLLAIVSAAGFLRRETFVNGPRGGRADVMLDMIPERAPFELGFYRALVRNGLEDPYSLQPTRRWTRTPNFYIHTYNPKTGRPLDSTELDLVINSIRQSVPQLTGGLFSAGSIETGDSAREPRTDYINVRIVYEPAEHFCGRAYVGANPGEIEINYDRCASTCGSMKVTPTAIAHEVGHALGFWHVDRGIMTAVVSNDCANVQFSEHERVHARLAYRRPAGNVDPDRDPNSFATVAPAEAARVACALAR